MLFVTFVTSSLRSMAYDEHIAFRGSTMFIDNRPAGYDRVFRPLMLAELFPAAISTTLVALLGIMAMALI